jgi:hypothetical protein
MGSAPPPAVPTTAPATSGQTIAISVDPCSDGGDPDQRVAKGPGRRPTLTLADRVVLTLIHDRFRLPVKDITKLFDIG